jgi:hypothetical protein
MNLFTEVEKIIGNAITRTIKGAKTMKTTKKTAKKMTKKTTKKPVKKTVKKAAKKPVQKVKRTYTKKAVEKKMVDPVLDNGAIVMNPIPESADPIDTSAKTVTETTAQVNNDGIVMINPIIDR